MEERFRRALAEAHALRVLGDTRAALEAYLAIRASGEGRHHLVAGLWAADLYMAQERFSDAVALTDEIRARYPADYRSGRARAELYRAVLLARQRRIPAMLDAVRWAVQEFHPLRSSAELDDGIEHWMGSLAGDLR